MFTQEEPTPLVVNQTELPKRRSEARIDDFSIELDMDNTGKQMFVVTGEAIERFAQMTNWDYYEAANRFQKVLEAAGMLLYCVQTADRRILIQRTNDDTNSDDKKRPLHR